MPSENESIVQMKTAKICIDNVKKNDIVPFISFGFDKYHNNLINEVICGPNNMIRKSDLEVFLRKYGYNDCKCRKSNITYIIR